MGVECLEFESTVWTETFHQVIDALHLKAIGQFNGRDMNGVEAESALTMYAEEMRVLVV